MNSDLKIQPAQTTPVGVFGGRWRDDARVFQSTMLQNGRVHEVH